MSTDLSVAVPGVAELPPRAAAVQRWGTLFITVVPLIGLGIAVASLWGWGLTPADAVAAGIFYVVAGLGVTIGFHRLFTHRSFEAGPAVRGAFAIAGSLSLEGNVISWVATHRRHHAYADEDGDPHSPHLSGDGLAGVLKGLWHAHTGWLFSSETTEPERWAPDLLKDRLIVRIDALFPILAIASLVLPGVIGYAVTGSPAGAFRMFLWAGLVRILLLHHVTWSINSICHYFGKRPFETTDESTNNWALSLLSFGESWHNNHHAFPSSAVHGIGRWQVDPSAFVIRALERVGLARGVKRVDERQLQRKIAGEGSVYPRPRG